MYLINLFIHLRKQNWISLSQFDVNDFIIYASVNLIVENMDVPWNRIQDILNGDVSRSNIINLLIVSTTFALSTSGNNVWAKVFHLTANRSIFLMNWSANEIFKLIIIRMLISKLLVQSRSFNWINHFKIFN